MFADQSAAHTKICPRSCASTSRLNTSWLQLEYHADGSVDPVIDHMMSSKVFRAAIWILLLSMTALGLSLVVISFVSEEKALALANVGTFCFLPLPFWLLCAMPCSRRLKWARCGGGYYIGCIPTRSDRHELLLHTWMHSQQWKTKSSASGNAVRRASALVSYRFDGKRSLAYTCSRLHYCQRAVHAMLLPGRAMRWTC